MNEYLETLRTEVPKDPWDQNFQRIFKSNWDNRYDYVRRFAWAIPNDEAIEALAALSPIVEIGAGTGYWTYLLRKAGADVVAFDKEPHENGYCNGQWAEVFKGGPEVLKRMPHRTLFLCWPPYSSPMATNCLRTYTGHTLAYIGEGEWGCTADDTFHRQLNKHWEQTAYVDLPRWSGIHDGLYIYKRLNRKGGE